MPDNLPAKLTKAVDGLMYPSESDEPFDVIQWGTAGSAIAQDQVAAHVSPGRKIEPVTLHDFFEQLAELDDADRYEQLRALMEKYLDNVAAFRVAGDGANVDVYLVGRSTSVGWVGVHTVSVET